MLHRKSPKAGMSNLFFDNGLNYKLKPFNTDSIFLAINIILLLSSLFACQQWSLCNFLDLLWFVAKNRIGTYIFAQYLVLGHLYPNSTKTSQH